MLNFDCDDKQAVSEAEATVREHFPMEWFRTYFDRENMLLTDYRETECYQSIAAMKSYDGTMIAFQHCNCGYGGHGPHNSLALLKMLGISQGEAEEFVFHHGTVELYFDEGGTFLPDQTNLTNVFESRETPCPIGKIDLRNVDYFAARERTLYLIEPHGDSIFTLVQLLQVMEPAAFSFYAGNDNSRYIDLTPVQMISQTGNAGKSPRSTHSFIVVKGRFFDVVCLLDKSEAKVFINNLADLLGSEKPFTEISVGGLTFLTDSTKPTPVTGWEKVSALAREPGELFHINQIKRKQTELPSAFSFAER